MADPWDPEFHEAEESREGEPEELLRPTADEPTTEDETPEALLHPTKREGSDGRPDGDRTDGDRTDDDQTDDDWPDEPVSGSSG